MEISVAELEASAASEAVGNWYRARQLPAMIAVPYPTGRPDARLQVDVQPEPDDAWLAAYHYRGQPLPPVGRRLLTSAPWQAFGSVRASGQTIAIGRVAVAGEWAGLTAIEVHPAHRRRGLATTITGALAVAAADVGAACVYLQVENDNVAARDLYRRAGFTDHHGYHYRISPAA
jgi:ribosomal protein S18 acetylase RimI-like enzyme